MDTNALVTIDYIINSYLNWKGVSSTADYNRYKQILIEGFTDMNLYHTTYYKTYITQVNSVNQIALPSDFIDWVSVALNNNGMYWQLDVNDAIIPEPSNVATVPVFGDHLNSPIPVGYKYSKMRKGVAEFKVDKQKRVITFIGNLKGQDVYLIYYSSGVPTDGTVYVPRELVMVLRSYLDWQIKLADDRVPLNVKIMAENEHGRQLVKYFEAQHALTGHEILNLFRNPIQQTIKR